MKISSRILLTLILACALCMAASATTAATSTLTTDAIINLPDTEAWTLFTTQAGLESLGYTQVKVELRLGGALQAASPTLPSLNSQILTLDTGHMLSFQPADNVGRAQWTVLYLTAMGKQMTQLRWLEFFPSEQHAAADQQQQRVRQLFDQLIRRYAPECEVCKLEKARLK